MDRHDEEPSIWTRRSRESRDGLGNATASGIPTGDVIQVDMTRLAGVLGCSLEELLQSLKRESTQEAEGITVETPQQLDLDESVIYPPPSVRQALLTTVSRDSIARASTEELPRPLWVLGGEGGKAIIELVLLNLMRGGVERVVIVVGKNGAKIKEAVSRSGVAEKLTIEFLEDVTEPYRQFHAKSILRARGAFDSPFLFVTSDHLFHPGLLHLLAVQDLGEDGGCVLVEDATEPEFVKSMAPTAVFVRRAQATALPPAESAGALDTTGENQVSRRVMAIGRRDQGTRQQWDGVECGALVLSTEIFDTLADIGKRRRYFTLADALDRMAGQCLLRSVSTEGKPWLALETQAQLLQGHEALIQGLVNERDLFPPELLTATGQSSTAAPPPDASSAGAAAAASAAEEHDIISHQRRVSLALDRSQTDHENQEDGTAPDFKGFIVPVEASTTTAMSYFADAGVEGPMPDEAAFLTRGQSVGRRVPLEDATVQVEEPTRPQDPETGDAGAPGGGGGPTVTLPWSGDKPGEVGFIVSVPAEDGGEELVFAVPDLPPKPTPTPGPCCGGSSGGGILGPCCGGGAAEDSDEEAGLLDDDLMEDYNCLGGGILNACLPELPTEMPSDIRSVRVTTEVVAKKGDEPTLAVHVIVDRRVPFLGWVLMVSALFGLAAMAPMGDLVSQMSPETAPPIFPVWRYTCSSIIYAPWFLLMVAGSKSARAELRDWSVMLPIVVAGIGQAGWGLCFYTALNFTNPNMVALLASLTPMCLVVWRGVTGESVHVLEIIGVLLALAGGVVSTVGQGEDGESDAIVDTVATGVEDSVSDGGQAFGYALGLGAACCGGLYILNAKAARSKVEVSHFAFIASAVPAFFCTLVLIAGYGGSPEGREMLFGPWGLLGWTQSPGLALAQIVSSILGDIIGNFGFYLLLKYISPLVVSLASLTVPLLAVVEGLMLGVVSPPGVLFGVGAFLILAGAATASVVTMLPHTEIFDATEAVKKANDGVVGESVGAPPDKSSRGPGASPQGYGSMSDSSSMKKRASPDGMVDGGGVRNGFGSGSLAHIRSLSVSEPKNTRNSDYYQDNLGLPQGSIAARSNGSVFGSVDGGGSDAAAASKGDDYLLYRGGNDDGVDNGGIGSRTMNLFK